MSFWKRPTARRANTAKPDVSRLDTRVTLQAPNHLPDGAGGISFGWDTIATVWAEVIPLSSVEERSGHQPHSVRFYRVVMRYRPDIAANQRLLVEDEALHIRSVLTLGRKRWLELLCDTGGVV